MTPDWQRLLPDTDFRWTMGLRPGIVAEFFAPCDATGAVCRERSQWLAEDADTYSSLTLPAEPALRETLALAASLGISIPAELPPRQRMQALAGEWEPDFLWMQPDEQGIHRLIGGVLCFPSAWDLHEKLGRPMSEIHGPVPSLNQALGRQIDVFLSKMVPGAAWTRENLSFRRDDELNHHPSLPRRPLDAGVSAEEVFLRIEHQLLLKLAPSNAILFGIRIEIVPLANLLVDAETTSRLRRELETMPETVAAYKGIGAARERLIELVRAGDPPEPVSAPRAAS